MGEGRRKQERARVAACWRWPHAHLPHPTLDSDMAAIGLMAIRFLRGEIAPISWGVHYGGTLELLVAAPLMALLGPTPLALNLSPSLISLVYVWFMYLIGRRLWGQVGGFTALALAALGPYYLLWFYTTARGLHAELLALGAALIWLTLRLLEAGPQEGTYRRLCLPFGLGSRVRILGQPAHGRGHRPGPAGVLASPLALAHLRSRVADAPGLPNWGWRP